VAGEVQCGGRLVKFLCVNDASAPPLPASLLVVFGVPEASSMEQRRTRGAGHRIGPRRAEVLD
jgi:hypothetical protein